MNQEELDALDSNLKAYFEAVDRAFYAMERKDQGAFAQAMIQVNQQVTHILNKRGINFSLQKASQLIPDFDSMRNFDHEVAVIRGGNIPKSLQKTAESLIQKHETTIVIAPVFTRSINAGGSFMADSTHRIFVGVEEVIDRPYGDSFYHELVHMAAQTSRDRPGQRQASYPVHFYFWAEQPFLRKSPGIYQSYGRRMSAEEVIAHAINLQRASNRYFKVASSHRPESFPPVREALIKLIGVSEIAKEAVRRSLLQLESTSPQPTHNNLSKKALGSTLEIYGSDFSTFAYLPPEVANEPIAQKVFIVRELQRLDELLKFNLDYLLPLNTERKMDVVAEKARSFRAKQVQYLRSLK